MNNELLLKIEHSKNVLRTAAEISKQYYHAPLILTYSGGKDSDVMLHLALSCLEPDEFEVLNSHTTVDAPQTIYHIRDTFKMLEEKGIKCTVKMPRYKGEPTSMWKLIVDKKIPPTRIMRYCCSVLKEASTANRIASLGVRESESAGRKGRNDFGILGRTKADGLWFSYEHIREVFADSLENARLYGKPVDEVDIEDCTFIVKSKEGRETVCNPIYKWTDDDVWEYIKESDIKLCDLYFPPYNYTRVGCVGCPLATVANQKREFEDFPIYKKNYIRAFDRMLERRKADNNKILKCDFKTGEEVFRWWLGEDPNQVRFEDFLGDFDDKGEFGHEK